MANNYRQRMAILAKNKERVLSVNNNLKDSSGCYIFHKIDENGFRKFYAGQAKRVLERVLSHFMEYDHIALSLKRYGLYNEDNPHGWQIDCFYCPENELDDKERETIAHWHIYKGYIPYNKTIGGQKGKVGIAENKPRKNYSDGLKEGYAKAIKEIQKLEQQRYERKKDGNRTARAITAQAEWDRIVKGER